MPGETQAHKELKALAAEWALQNGYLCAGFEISLPYSGYRVDVAVYRPAYRRREVTFEGRTLRQQHPVVGGTAVFECKQCRSDLLNDACVSEEARCSLIKLNAREEVLESLLKIHPPSLARGDSLFEEYVTHNLEAANHKGYLGVLRRLRALQNNVSSGSSRPDPLPVRQPVLLGDRGRHHRGS